MCRCSNDGKDDVKQGGMERGIKSKSKEICPL